MTRRLTCIALGSFFATFFTALPAWSQIAGTPQTTPARPSLTGSAPSLPVDANVERAREAFRKGQMDECLNLLREAVKQNEKLPPAKLMFARMWAEANQPQVARMALEQAASEEPHHPDIYLQLGDIALREGRFTDALLLFREGMDVLKHGKWTEEQQNNVKTACHSGMAAAYEARGAWAEAQKSLEAALKINPKIGRLRQRLGRALFMLDKRAEAEKEFQQAVVDDPNLEPDGVTLGKLLSAKGEYKKAEEYFSYAAKAQPNNLQARLGYGYWLMEQDRFDEAEREANAAAGIDGKSLEVRFFQGFVARGRRQFEQAERIFDDLLRDNPANFQASNQLALVLVAQGTDAKKRRALELAEVNARQYQREAEALSTLGWIYYKLGRLTEAQQLLASVYQGTGGNLSAETAYYLACVLAEQQRYDDVRKLLEGALKLKGRFFYRREAQEMLNNLPKSTLPNP
jgi:tetratricopeptide (TPR) repeat protein